MKEPDGFESERPTTRSPFTVQKRLNRTVW